MPKKKFMVVPREKLISLSGLDTTRGHRNFGKKNKVMYVSEPSEAAEIDARYGLKGGTGDVMVFEDDRYSKALKAEHWDINKNNGEPVYLHHYIFGGMGLKQEMHDFANDPAYERIGAGRYRKKQV
jgi:hypothetical protein